MARDFREGYGNTQTVSYHFTETPHKDLARDTDSLGGQVQRTLGLEQNTGCFLGWEVSILFYAHGKADTYLYLLSSSLE